MKEILKRLWERWKRIAHVIGRFQTRLLVSVFYFLVLSPTGGLMRLFGWDPLQSRRSKRRRATNWQPVERSQPDLESLRRQS